MVWTCLQRAANAATILAFFTAAYAIINPTTVSAFLEDISRANERLADEIPYWITLNGDVDQEVFSYLSRNTDGAAFAVPLKNEGNFPITDIIVKVYDHQGELVIARDRIFLAPFGAYTIYAVAQPDAFAKGMSICMKGYSTRADKELFERRVLVAEGLAGKNTMFTTEYEFTDQNRPPSCQ